MSMRVADLTVEELVRIVQDAIEDKLSELLGDPDEGLELREDIRARLVRSMEAERQGAKGIPAADAAAQLGLDS
jgi:hypothetical protein